MILGRPKFTVRESLALNLSKHNLLIAPSTRVRISRSLAVRCADGGILQQRREELVTAVRFQRKRRMIGILSSAVVGALAGFLLSWKAGAYLSTIWDVFAGLGVGIYFWCTLSYFFARALTRKSRPLLVQRIDHHQYHGGMRSLIGLAMSGYAIELGWIKNTTYLIKTHRKVSETHAQMNRVLHQMEEWIEQAANGIDQETFRAAMNEVNRQRREIHYAYRKIISRR